VGDQSGVVAALSAPRVTWEQSARRWGEQLLRAGYAEVTPRGRWEYWSAPAFLLTARGK
jgi:hypothetical protein